MRSDQPMPFEDAIDEVARGLTAIPPSPALRAGVRRRVGAQQTPGVMSRWRLGIGAAAAVVLAVTLWWPSTTPLPSSGLDTRGVMGGPTMRVASLLDRPDAMADRPSRSGSDADARRGRTPGRARLPQPLIAAQPLAIAPLELDLLETPLIAADAGSPIPPIGIEPIRFDTLSP